MLCGLDSSQPMPQVPWPNKTTVLWCYQFCPPISWLKSCWITQLPGVFVSPSCQMVQEAMLCRCGGWRWLGLWLLCGQEPTVGNSQTFLNRCSDQEGSCGSALPPRHEKTRHQGQQNSFFGDPHLAGLNPAKFPRLCH